MAFRAWRETKTGGLAPDAEVRQEQWRLHLTLAAVKVNMGRKMTASLASGILVQTAARTVMMAPDWTHDNQKKHMKDGYESSPEVISQLSVLTAPSDGPNLPVAILQT